MSGSRVGTLAGSRAARALARAGHRGELDRRGARNGSCDHVAACTTGRATQGQWLRGKARRSPSSTSSPRPARTGLRLGANSAICSEYMSGYVHAARGREPRRARYSSACTTARTASSGAAMIASIGSASVVTEIASQMRMPGRGASRPRSRRMLATVRGSRWSTPSSL